jgi:ribosomal protein S18 acetylase RimI-like enzyme
LDKVKIIKLEEVDKEPVSVLMTKSLIEEYGEPPDSETLNSLLEYYYKRSDSCIFCLKEGKSFAGFIWLIDSSDVITGVTFTCILYLAVKPEFRGKKYSRLLMEKAKEHCKERKIREVRLTVRHNNDPALHLYDSLGFKTYKHEMLMKLD